MVMRNFSYFGDADRPARKHAALMRPALAGVRYDTIIGTGLSGAVIVPLLARAMRKNWAIIRKENDGSHATGAIYEGQIGQRWIIVDDQISSGATVARIIGRVRAAWEQTQPYGDALPEFMGVYLYQYGSVFRPASLYVDNVGVIGRAFTAYRGVEPTPVKRERPNGALAGCTCIMCASRA